MIQNKSSYNSWLYHVQAFLQLRGTSIYWGAPVRRVRQRRDATGAPMREPEWQGGTESALPAFWPEGDKSREREGSALAVKKSSSFI